MIQPHKVILDKGLSNQIHYLWRIALPLLTGAALAQALMRQGIPVLYPFIQNEFGLSRAQVGLITSVQFIGLAAAVLVAGWLTDTFGVKRMIAIALLGRGMESRRRRGFGLYTSLISLWQGTAAPLTFRYRISLVATSAKMISANKVCVPSRASHFRVVLDYAAS